MSEPNPPTSQPNPPPPYPQAYHPAPVIYSVPPQRAPMGCLLGISLVLNLIVGGLLLLGCLGVFDWGFGGGDDADGLIQTHHEGKKGHDDRIAIITLNGVIMEGLLNYTHKQIEQAAKDDKVKAVVFRINSPGGSITASDDLWRRITKLRDGDEGKKRKPKKVIVSMGSMAASGGYYVAMPAEYLFAERTSVTGSIGVYASFPNIAGLAKENNVEMITIKQGEIKDSGSPFKEMKPKERTVFQSMVNQAYNDFVNVVVEGRPNLKYKPLHRFPYTPVNVEGQPEPNPEEDMTRYIADGGIYTAREALDLKLIDEIGNLDDAINKARELAGLSQDAEVIRYEKQKTLGDILLGVNAADHKPLLLTSGRLHEGLIPRLWYLAPGCELAGLVASVEGK